MLRFLVLSPLVRVTTPYGISMFAAMVQSLSLVRSAFVLMWHSYCFKNFKVCFPWESESLPQHTNRVSRSCSVC